MKLPRVRIADLMALVLIVALDAAAIRAFEDHVLVVGGLPMANVLAVAWLLGRRRRGSRPFLACGVAALALFVTMTSFCRVRDLEPYLNLYFDPLERVIPPGGPAIIEIPLCVAVGVVALVLPQLVLALIGGLLVRKFMHRLAPDTPETTP